MQPVVVLEAVVVAAAAMGAAVALTQRTEVAGMVGEAVAVAEAAM